MRESEIQSMNRAFRILDDRKSRILDNKRTLKLKDRVKKIREDSLSNLDELLETATGRLQENGAEVVFARTPEDVLKTVYNIVEDEPIVAKSKSNAVDEVGVTDFLEKQGIEFLETDLGDRIMQFYPESKPSHPIGPASHLNMKQIANLASKRFKTEVKPEPREILDIVKADVLHRISGCMVGITGANAVAAEDGSIVTVHNEGNISMVSMLDTHIVIVGIEKLVKTLEDAVSVVKLQTIYATGKKISSYINIESGPSKTADIEQVLLKDMYGAKRLVVIFVDNGRSQALKYARESLMCIGCGSCIVTCPIYNAVGYDFGYKRHLGGRGVVLSRFMGGKQVCFDSGLFRCAQCGLCTENCPVDIKTSDLIGKLRRESVESGIFCDEHSKIAERIRKRGSPFL